MKLPLPSQVILLDRHWTKDDIGHGVTDRNHGQLSLHLVDHVGHGVGEIFKRGSVELVRHNTNAEYLQVTFTLYPCNNTAETFSSEENMKMGLNLAFFIL